MKEYYSYDRALLEVGMTVYYKHEYPLREYVITEIDPLIDRIECKDTIEYHGRTYVGKTTFNADQLIVNIDRTGYFYVREATDEYPLSYISNCLSLGNYMYSNSIKLLFDIVDCADKDYQGGKLYYGNLSDESTWVQVSIDDMITDVFQHYLKANNAGDAIRHWFKDNTIIY